MHSDPRQRPQSRSRSGSTPVLPARIRERAALMLAAKPRVMIGIAGAPGAGKSTLADLLAQAFAPLAQVVPMDGFHLANAELARLGRSDRKGAPDTFDAHGYLALLQRLRAQGSQDAVVYAPSFRREIEEPIANAIPIDAASRLLIAEGNYLLLDEAPWPAIAACLDAVWYLDVEDAEREPRLLARHQRFGRSADAAQAWLAQTDAPNARRIAEGRAHADWLVRWTMTES